MNCEMCGKQTEDLYKTNIESTIMSVCSECSRYGKVTERLKKETPKKEFKQRMQIQEPKQETIEVIVPDYAKKIRKAREQMGIKQEEFAKKVNEKESQIHKMETGSVTPSLKTAKKLEKILHIKLTEEYIERQNPLEKEKETVMTLGDLVKIKKN